MSRSALVAVLALAEVASGCGSSSPVAVAPTTSIRLLPTSTTRAPPTTTSVPPPSRPAVAPVQTSAMPREAFVAVGSKLVAIDTGDPTKQRTATEFTDAGINWVTVDRPRDRVFFGVTSGCDPGVNGTYVMPLDGGARRKISPSGFRAAVSPDGKRIAYSVSTDGCGTREIVVQQVEGGPRTTFTASHSVAVGAWSTDGQTLIFNTEGGTPTAYRFHPFVSGAHLDGSPRWDAGIVSDAGGGRVAILDWCPPDQSGACVVGVRTRPEIGAGPDYSFGRVANVESTSVDTSGQWPLLIVGRRTTGDNSISVVQLFERGTWRDLSPGGAADW